MRAGDAALCIQPPRGCDRAARTRVSFKQDDDIVTAFTTKVRDLNYAANP